MRANPALLLLALPCLLTACPDKPPPPPPPETGRCDVDLAASGLFEAVGSGAEAWVLGSEGAPSGVGGPQSRARAGDVLLQNDRVRVIISQPGPVPGVLPHGGALLDADLKRQGGPGRDQLGGLGLLTAFGRTVAAEKVEILESGEFGGRAVVAVTGSDAPQRGVDFADRLVAVLGGGPSLTIDPAASLPLRISTYYVLAPGESRVRMLTAFCATGSEAVTLSVGEVIDPGGARDFFNPQGCRGGLGARGCEVDTLGLIGFQGDDVAYGYRAMSLADLRRPDTEGATFVMDGLHATVAGGSGPTGLLRWTDAQASERPGTLRVPAGGQALFLRDLFVARDLGELQSVVLATDGQARARLPVRVRWPDESPAAGARVAVISPATDRLITLMTTREDGTAATDLPAGAWRLVAGIPGTGLELVQDVVVAAGDAREQLLVLPGPGTLTVRVQDETGAPLAAKVTLVCPSGACVQGDPRLGEFLPLPTEVAAVALVPPSGVATLRVPASTYAVTVTRGPAWSAWPETFPVGELITLGAAEVVRDVTLNRVVDAADWRRAELGARGAASPGVSTSAELRVRSALSEGLELLASGDLGAITRLDPVLEQLGSAPGLTLFEGESVRTPGGILGLFPRVAEPGNFANGALDGAGLRLDEVLSRSDSLATASLTVLRDPRGVPGAFSRLQLDTATLATHAVPEALGVQPASGASATDTRLFPRQGLEAMEVMATPNPDLAILNDWMTFASRGLLLAPLSGHSEGDPRSGSSGLPFTWLRSSGTRAEVVTAAIRAGALAVSNGPLLQVRARAAGSSDAFVPAGGLVSLAAGASLEVEVEVLAPAWMRFQFLELYSHAPGREALAGAPNQAWPEERVLARHTVTAEELIPEPFGAASRIHVVHRFTTPVTGDAWFAVLLRSSSAAPTYFPMAWEGVSCSDTRCEARAIRPFALSSPVLVDGDGSGAYDAFPLP